MTSSRIIVDRLPGYTRTALIKAGILTDLFVEDADDPAPRPGAVVRARVERVFPDHHRASLDIGGMSASMRIRDAARLRSGEVMVATVTAEPREGKPLQLRRGIFRAGRYVIIESGTPGLRLSMGLREAGYIPPEDLRAEISTFTVTLRRSVNGADLEEVRAELNELTTWGESINQMPSSGSAIIAPALSGHEEAALLEPDAEVVIDDDGRAWEEAGLDEALQKALAPTLPLAGGGVIHVSTPPGAAVIDGDSGVDALPPMRLALSMVPATAHQLRLRRIGGPVVVDFPRLGAKDRRRISQLMAEHVRDDPCRPSCHGFTEGGLFTLTRPWRWRPLSTDISANPAQIGRDALRLARNHGARHPRRPVEICLPPAGLAWLEGPGASHRLRVEERLALPPRFRSDNSLEHAISQDITPMRKS